MTAPKIHLGKMPAVVFKRMAKFHGRARHPAFIDRTDSKPPTPLIEIDPRTKGRKRIEILLHEAAHLALPGMTEETVAMLARYQARVLHGVGYTADEAEMNENFKEKPE